MVANCGVCGQVVRSSSEQDCVLCGEAITSQLLVEPTVVIRIAPPLPARMVTIGGIDFPAKSLAIIGAALVLLLLIVVLVLVL